MKRKFVAQNRSDLFIVRARWFPQTTTIIFRRRFKRPWKVHFSHLIFLLFILGDFWEERTRNQSISDRWQTSKETQEFSWVQLVICYHLNRKLHLSVIKQTTNFWYHLFLFYVSPSQCLCCSHTHQIIRPTIITIIIRHHRPNRTISFRVSQNMANSEGNRRRPEKLAQLKITKRLVDEIIALWLTNTIRIKFTPAPFDFVD